MQMNDYWVIPNETKKVLVKAERYEIADGVLRFYIEDKEVAVFRWDGVVGFQIGEAKKLVDPKKVFAWDPIKKERADWILILDEDIYNEDLDEVIVL